MIKFPFSSPIFKTKSDLYIQKKEKKIFILKIKNKILI